MFTSPGSIAFSIYSLNIHWYGIIMALAILCAIFCTFIIKNKFYKDITDDSIFDISFILIVIGIICARLYYVILDWKYFEHNIILIPCIWNGGISIHGAIFGGIIGLYIYAKIKKLNFLRYADLFSFGLVTGQIIGRWGNFFNSEAFGIPCDLPWKLYIPQYLRPIEYKNYQFFHPAFLYESLLNIVILAILIFILKKYTNIKAGTIFFAYTILYAIARCITESIRIDSILNIFPSIHIAHFASLILLIIGISGLIYIHAKKA